VCGIQERHADFSRNTLYNTVVTIGPDGSLLNRHRKVMPTSPERMAWGFGDASGLKAVDTPCGRVGALLCWENYLPLARCAMYAQGVDIYVAPTYDSGERWIASMQHIAREGGCWVLGSCCAFRGRDIPASCRARFSSTLRTMNGSTAAIRSRSLRAARLSRGRCTKRRACSSPTSSWKRPGCPAQLGRGRPLCPTGPVPVACECAGDPAGGVRQGVNPVKIQPGTAIGRCGHKSEKGTLVMTPRTTPEGSTAL
jgi:hypothetical protein